MGSDLEEEAGWVVGQVQDGHPAQLLAFEWGFWSYICAEVSPASAKF